MPTLARKKPASIWMPVHLALMLAIALISHPVLADPIPVISKPFS
ncbi:hypothetical protein MNBD_GAMMA19-2196, partial [hydrothermal vent metagenome]